MAAGSHFVTEMVFEYGVPRELVPGVSRLVARNPGPFTFKGTNTYLVGTTALAIIDPGPGDDAHVEAIVEAVGRRRVSHILVTHRHLDHTGATEQLRRRIDAPVYAFGPVNFDISETEPNGGSIDFEFSADILLRDGEQLTGPDWSIEVVHTPGHLRDHVCFRLVEQQILFSGDHVMAWNTSVIAPPNGSMAEYLASLDKVENLDVTAYCPGHGGRIREPRRTIKAFKLHRKWREEAIIASLEAGHHTIDAIVLDVYHGLDDKLVRAASLSVQAHIQHLAERGRVTYSRPLTFSRAISISVP